MDFEFGFKTLWPIATAAFWFWVNGISGRLKEADKLKEELHAVKLSYHTKQDAQADRKNIAASLERIEDKLEKMNEKLDRKADKS